MADDDGYWFAAKRYGWGWGLPLVWQGWAVIVAYLMVVTAPVLLVGVLGPGVSTALSLGGLVVATPLLVLVCLRKGEPPRWRWGRDDPGGS